MDINVLRETLHKTPFQPFRIRLADGREFYVPHPDFVALSHRTVAVISHQTDAVTVLEPLLIISLELGGGQPADQQQAGS